LRLKPVFLPLLLCFLLSLANFNAFAQATRLTLDDAVNLAIEYNLNLQKHQIDLAASGYSEKKLWSEIFPSINASASVGYRTGLFSDTSNSMVIYNIGLNVNLGLNAGIPYTIRNIRLAHRGNILRYEDARNQLVIQITKRFYSCVAEKNNLLFLEEVLNLAQSQFTRNEVLFRNGLTGELSLMQSRLAVENARFNLIAARTAYNNNMSEFLAMLGMSSDSGAELLGEVNIKKIDTDAELLIREHLHLRPDIVRAAQEIERLENVRMQTAMQSRSPSVNLSVDWNSLALDPFTDSLSATARLSIPIDPWIPGTSRAQAIARAADAVEKAKLDLEITETSARTQIHSLSALLRNSWESIFIARLSLEVANRGYQLTEQGFRNGTIEALVLQDARNNMANAMQRLLQAELSYFNMILDLSAALNIDWKNFIQIYGVIGE